VRSGPIRFSPTAWQLVALDALVGVVAYALATGLRFLDEGSVPDTYLQRLVPWLIGAAVLQVGVGELMTRLRKPGSALARHPVLPFLIATAVSLGIVLLVNDILLREPWRLPHFVAVVAPLLAGAGSAALRLAATRSVEVEELLTRPIVRLDADACAPALAGKRILITGAAGSIGAELARQVLAVRPASVVAVDTNETGLYELENDLAALHTDIPVRTCIADVSYARHMRELFALERPQVVFHAAAYKHVPLVEANPDQGFATNVLGTLSICEAAIGAGSERVVVISTDKAVNPSSFMGLTKRVAELMVVGLGEQAPATVLSAVRFGNVLGSRGSVVPTLLRQIDAGGPITITHRDAQRFFMTISEAASLVLMSAAFGTTGGLYVLDMGAEVRISELAERLVRLRGLRPGRDVTFSYVGLRPGEKLREELHAADELLVPTARDAVWHVDPQYAVDGAAVLADVRALAARRSEEPIDPASYPGLLRALIARATRAPAISPAS
jgi:FlaA1/EpsC-like NDP-sugar epimerase